MHPESVSDHSTYMVAGVLIVAGYTNITDGVKTAITSARALLASPYTPKVYAMTARTGLALFAATQGDRSEARELYSALESQRHTVLPIAGVSADRLLGLLAQTSGERDKAIIHFEDALSFCGKYGYRPELAWTCHDYAGLILNGQPLGDRTKAMELLVEANGITVELGMILLQQRVITLLEQAGSLPVKPPQYPGGLTQREVEVLVLVAAGRTDREIAEELVISLRTVTTHVSNILSKTGSVNRTEAAGYASRQGIGA